MGIQITASFRKDAYTFNRWLPPSRKNPGGGLARKAEQLQRAVPTLTFIEKLESAGGVHIMEPLWFSSGQTHDDIMARLSEWRKCAAYKILWTCDFEMLRWTGDFRAAVLDAADVVAGNSPYMVQLLQAFSGEVALLSDVLDVDMFQPARLRQPVLYGCSQLIQQKGIAALCDIFEGLPPEFPLHRVFIGDADVWGVDIAASRSAQLVNRVLQTTDRWYGALTFAEVQEIAERATAFIVDTNYDTFCYALHEALAGGCYAFCGSHPVFDIVQGVTRFTGNASALLGLEIFYEEHLASGAPVRYNEEGVQYVAEHCSIPVFRKQLLHIIGGTL